MTVVYLVRHGETHWNRVRRLQGQKDSPLTLRGVRQVQAMGARLGEALAGCDCVQFVASPLGRAVQSAAIIADTLELPFDEVRIDDRLKERNQGAFDGLNAEEIEAGFAPDPQQRRGWNFAAPGGESMAELHARVSSFLAEPDAAPVRVAICHGVVSRVMRGAYLGLLPQQVVELPSHSQDTFYRLANGRVEVVDCPPVG